MTKSISNRIIAISMALLMIVSSTGFSMDVHYCQNQIKGISLFGEAKSCHAKQTAPPCHKNKKTCQHQGNDISQQDKDSCCHNESIVIDKTDVDAPSPQLSAVQDIQLDFVTAFVSVYMLNYNVKTEFQSFNQYIPPLPDRDFKVLYQTFLI